MSTPAPSCRWRGPTSSSSRAPRVTSVGAFSRSSSSHGHRVRCLARRPDSLTCTRESPAVEVVAGDVLDPASLARALTGVHTAYYLVHSMGSAVAFEETDRHRRRELRARRARGRGQARIIYLGGLGDASDELSPHLRSRQEVGAVLGASGVPVIELRASIVIGSGSLSFEMIRALVERLPVMIMPRWVGVMAQPIGIGDLLQYLVAALDRARSGESGIRDRGCRLCLLRRHDARVRAPARAAAS